MYMTARGMEIKLSESMTRNIIKSQQNDCTSCIMKAYEIMKGKLDYYLGLINQGSGLCTLSSVEKIILVRDLLIACLSLMHKRRNGSIWNINTLMLMHVEERDKQIAIIPCNAY